MSLKTPLISKSRILRTLIAAAVISVIGGCSLFGTKKPDPVPFREKVFTAPFEDVERAVKQAMLRYPVKVDNPDAGIYETDWVKDDQRFRSAAMKNDYSEGFQYRLLVRMVRGKANTKGGVKVTIRKEAFLNRDFFAEPESVSSDGTEEDVILYRVTRELALERAVKRMQDKNNNQK